jgi:hypothetical protein
VSGLKAAATLVLDLEQALRQHPGQKVGSTRSRKNAARLSGALAIWEAVTGLEGAEALDRARAIATQVDAP